LTLYSHNGISIALSVSFVIAPQETVKIIYSFRSNKLSKGGVFFQFWDLEMISHGNDQFLLSTIKVRFFLISINLHPPMTNHLKN